MASRVLRKVVSWPFIFLRALPGAIFLTGAVPLPWRAFFSASETFKVGMRMLPAERGLDPDDLYDAMRWIAEDFGHPAHLPRAGDPAEIGPVIAFVGSRVNSYMTGANINVDGGSDFT